MILLFAISPTEYYFGEPSQIARRSVLLTLLAPTVLCLSLMFGRVCTLCGAHSLGFYGCLDGVHAINLKSLGPTVGLLTGKPVPEILERGDVSHLKLLCAVGRTDGGDQKTFYACPALVPLPRYLNRFTWIVPAGRTNVYPVPVE